MGFLPRILNPLSVIEGLLHSQEQAPTIPGFLLIPPGLPRRRDTSVRPLAECSPPSRRRSSAHIIKGLCLAKFLAVPTDSTRSLNALSCPPFISEFRRP
jgi:hypothetical protein